jgi:metal-dependent HD superfamily phosphatase/phosphodiesterase
MRALAAGDRGPVRLDVWITESGGEWQIEQMMWRYIEPPTRPAK